MLPASLSRVLWAILASTSWMIVSSYLIILNRHLMCDLKFAYPMTLSGMGMITSWILSVLACRVFKWVEAKQIITLEFWVTRILPVGFFTAVTLWTGNEVYLYLSISFIQMLKAFTPVITLICLTIAGLEVPSKSMITAVLLTAAGTALAAYGEVNLSFLGLIINTTSAVAESIRLVLAQYLLTGLKFHPIEGLMHMAPACMLWLYAGALVVEMPKMVPAMAWKIVLNHPIKFCGAALLGFCVNVLAFLSIKLASSLTLKVLGTVKNTLMVMASVMFLGEVVTLVQGFGYGVAVLGFAWYTKIKTAQISEAPPSSSALTKEQQKIKDMEDPPLKPIMDHSGSLASLKQPLLTFKSGSSFSS